MVVAVAEGAAEREAVAEGPRTLAAGEGERAAARLVEALPEGAREACRSEDSFLECQCL